MEKHLLLPKDSSEPLKVKLINTWFQFQRTLKIRWCDTLNDILSKYNNSYHSTIKMKPIDVKSNTYMDSSEKINNKDPKFKIGDIVRILKYKNILAKGYTPNWSEKSFVIKKVKNTALRTYVSNDLNEEDLVGTF